MATFLPGPPSNVCFFPQHHISKWSHGPPFPNSTRVSSFKPTICCRSSLQTPESSPVSAEESSSLPPPVEDELASQSGSIIIENADTTLPIRGCKTCGREEIEKGCNGEGRIQGGIATVPGFGWWPIKAYRPCPGFLASGGRYRRRGQSMDEVAFGREEREDSTGSMEKASKKRQSALKFRR